MNKIPYFAMVFTSAIILAGCLDDPNQNTQEAVPVIVADESLYAYYWEEGPQDEFSISDGELTGDILKLTISFLGGCEEHEFELIAWTGISKRNPPIGHFLLTHDSHADTCTAEISEVLLFELTPYKEHLKSSGLLESGTILLSIRSGLGWLASYNYCFN